MTIICEGWLTTILHGENCWIFTKNNESECNVYKDISGKISNSEIVCYFLQAMWENRRFSELTKREFIVLSAIKDEVDELLLCENIKLGLQMEEEDIEEGKAMFLQEQSNTEKQDEITKEEEEETYEYDGELGLEHYHDDLIDVRSIDEFGLFVLANNEGSTETVAWSTWHYHPHDLLEAYGQLIDELDLDEEDTKTHILKFKQYLIDTGTSEEELED